MKYKLIAFDVDGTLIANPLSVFISIFNNSHIPKKELKKLVRDFMFKKIDYDEAFYQGICLLKKSKLTKKQLLESMSGLRLNEGVNETLKKLKDSNYRLAIISASFNIALEKLIPDYLSIFSYIFINEILFDEHGNVKEGQVTKHNFEGKALALKEIAEKENIKLSECVFIGDASNDVEVAKVAGLSIAFNSISKTLKRVSDIVVEGNDIRGVLKYIE